MIGITPYLIFVKLVTVLEKLALFMIHLLQSEINLKIEDFSDAHHLNGAGAEKFTAILCKTIQRRAAGESVDDLFYQTVEEKLTLTPDDSVLMAYYAKLQDE